MNVLSHTKFNNVKRNNLPVHVEVVYEFNCLLTMKFTTIRIKTNRDIVFVNLKFYN